MRLFPTVLLCLVLADAAAAQVDPVEHGVVVVLHEHGCEIGDGEAREALARRGIGWGEALDAMRRLVEAGQAYVTDGGRTFGILPPLCEPEPVVVAQVGPDPAPWLRARLAGEEDCGMPLGALRAEALAAGFDAERFDRVVRSMGARGGLREAGQGEMRLARLQCARARHPADADLGAIDRAPTWALDRYLADALAARGCRMAWAEPEGASAELAGAVAGPLGIGRRFEELTPVARATLAGMVRDAMAAHPERFAVDTRTEELVLRDCAG